MKYVVVIVLVLHAVQAQQVINIGVGGGQTENPKGTGLNNGQTVPKYLK